MVKAIETVRHQFFKVAGNYAVKLKVKDANGNSYQVENVISVIAPANQYAQFDFTPQPAIVDEPVYFAAEYVSIPGTTIVHEFWDFGDGSSATPTCCNQAVQHTYTAAGEYKVSLTITTSNGAKYRKVKTVSVEEVSAPNIIITATDENDAYEADSGQILPLYTFPAIVKLRLNKSENQGTLVDAQWDFGDGHTGFGLNPEWIYHKPGVYTVAVTAKDSNGNTGTSSLVVKVYSQNCPDNEFGACLNLSNSVGNVLPMSLTEWTLNHYNGSEDFKSSSLPAGWISLKTVDQTPEVVIPIDDVVTVDGDTLKIDKTSLVNKSINLTVPYTIEVVTELLTTPDPTDYTGVWPKAYFGIGTLNVTTNENDVNLVLEGVNTKYKRYVKLGNLQTYSFADLPADSYILTAIKENRSNTYNSNIVSSTPISIAVDITQLTLDDIGKRQKAEFEKKKQKLNTQVSLELNRKITPLSGFVDECGSPDPFPPFRLMSGRFPGNSWSAAWAGFDWHGAGLPSTTSQGEVIDIECRIQRSSDLYTYWNWATLGVIGRCNVGQSRAEQLTNLWESKRDGMLSQDAALLMLEYEIKDLVTQVKEKGSFKFSAASARAQAGITLEGVNYTTGVSKTPPPENFPMGGDVFWSTKLYIPKGYVRPVLKAKLTDFLQSGETGSVCGFYRSTEDVQLKAVRAFLPQDNLIFTQTPSVKHDAKSNAVKLVKTSKFLPLHIDREDLVVGEKKLEPSRLAPELFEAKFKVEMDIGSLSIDEVTGIDISYEYGENNIVGPFNSKIYNKRLDPNIKNKLFGEINLDISDVDGEIDYDPDVREVKLIFEATGPGVANTNKVQHVYEPMYNVRRLTGANKICKDGWYSERISAYATRDMIEAMKKAESNPDVRFRCNDFSLPWGGDFQIYVPWALQTPYEKSVDNENDGYFWEHGTHSNGKAADVRYFTKNIAEIDSYNIGEGNMRLGDVNEYLNFSSEAKMIADSTILDVTGRWQKKMDAVAYCNLNPTLPCYAGITESDFTHDVMLRLCQWHASGSNNLTFCPSGTYLDSIKRYSAWVEKNIENLSVLESSFKFNISDGQLKEPDNFSNLTVAKDWQVKGLNLLRWPDGKEIWGTNGSIILAQRVQGCENVTCNFQSIKKIRGHFSHIHLMLK